MNRKQTQAINCSAGMTLKQSWQHLNGNQHYGILSHKNTDYKTVTILKSGRCLIYLLAKVHFNNQVAEDEMGGAM
jgi:hypothetical protein